MKYYPRLLLSLLTAIGIAYITSATPLGSNQSTGHTPSPSSLTTKTAHPNSTSDIPPRDVQIVYSPPITQPTKGEHVTAGKPFWVCWQTAHVPQEKRDSEVEIFLGRPQGGNEHIDTAHRLAKESIMAGKARVTVPSSTPPRNDYVVFVMGDSGNKSPRFTIVNGNHA